MNNLSDYDDLDEILSMENIMASDCEEKFRSDCVSISANENESVGNLDDVLFENAHCKVSRDKLQHQYRSNFAGGDAEDCNSMLNLNKRIICFLSELKQHITSALETCEQKLMTVEFALQKHTIGDAKLVTCNAGMPYFKDRNYFSAANNEDEILKENRGELQIRNLPKVTLWTTKERNTFLKAMQIEAVTNAEYTQRRKRSKELEDSRFTVTSAVDEDNIFQRTFGRLGEKEFDWHKVSSVYFEDKHSPLDCRVMWNVFLRPDISKDSWKRAEDSKLKEVAKRQKFQNWEKIAEDLGTNRTGYQCFIRFNTKKKLPKAKNCTWENKEDDRLLKLVNIFQIGDFIPWGEVASWMQKRTKQQVYFRWTYSLAPYLVKGRFTRTEDNLLQDAVIKYGTNFCKISAALLPNRSTIQLQSRYNTLIANKVANGNVWTFEEDSKLLQLFEQFGSNWSKLAKAFSFKTRTQLRHRHAALQKYISRGKSIFDLHKNHSNCRTSGDQTQENKTRESETGESEIDKELIQYFRKDYASRKRNTCKNALRPLSIEELKRKTTNLYGILRLLNAKLSIPDDISNVPLSDRDAQLLHSLKDYIKMKSDRERYTQVVNKFRSRMFSSSSNYEETSKPVSLSSSYESQTKLKKSDKSRFIDYILHRQETFLVQRPREFNTPDSVTSYIGGDEQELQFQKLAHLLQCNSTSVQQRFCTLPNQTWLKRYNNEDADKSNCSSNNVLREAGPINCFQSCKASSPANDITFDRECVVKSQSESLQTRKPQKKRSIMNNIPPIVSSAERLQESSPLAVKTFDNLETPGPNKLTAAEASYATLQSFQHLLHFKRFKEKRASQDLSHAVSQEAFNLLETRLEQLFKYPIGLSKTVLPTVYGMNTVLHDNKIVKRKASQTLNVLTQQQVKKLRLHNSHNRNLR